MRSGSGEPIGKERYIGILLLGIAGFILILNALQPTGNWFCVANPTEIAQGHYAQDNACVAHNKAESPGELRASEAAPWEWATGIVLGIAGIAILLTGIRFPNEARKIAKLKTLSDMKARGVIDEAEYRRLRENVDNRS